jgi:hypothetical protein
MLHFAVSPQIARSAAAVQLVQLEEVVSLHHRQFLMYAL